MPAGMLLALFFVAAIIAFATSLRQTESRYGREYTNVILGVWTEILVTLIPFIVLVIVAAVRGTLSETVAGPELGLASAVLCGLALLKFFQAAAGSSVVRANVERALFLVVCTLIVLIVVLVLVAAIALGHQSRITMYAQVAFLFVSMVVYSALAGGGQLLLQRER